jgi:hypothetical protein
MTSVKIKFRKSTVITGSADSERNYVFAKHKGRFSVGNPADI